MTKAPSKNPIADHGSDPWISGDPILKKGRRKVQISTTKSPSERLKGKAEPEHCKTGPISARGDKKSPQERGKVKKAKPCQRCREVPEKKKTA